MDDLFKSVYISKGVNPFENLAIEEYFISVCKENEIILYLWQNDNTIVIGKHQNPYKECNLELMKQDEVKLVRRKSGGGAVYHDLGNLNYTIVANSDNYNLEKNFQIILSSLKEWNIIAKQTGRNDITVGDKKISGSAFILENGISCHHGSILIDSKLEKLGEYLTPSKIKIQSKGIDSVRARVANLVEFNNQIKVDDFINTLITKFNETFVGELRILDIPFNETIREATINYGSWKWIVAESPKATISITKKYSWGTVEISLSIKDGIITNCMINSDTLYDVNFKDLEIKLKEMKLESKLIKAVIDNNIVEVNICYDLNDIFYELLQNLN